MDRTPSPDVSAWVSAWDCVEKEPTPFSGVMERSLTTGIFARLASSGALFLSSGALFLRVNTSSTFREPCWASSVNAMLLRRFDSSTFLELRRPVGDNDDSTKPPPATLMWRLPMEVWDSSCPFPEPRRFWGLRPCWDSSVFWEWSCWDSSPETLWRRARFITAALCFTASSLTVFPSDNFDGPNPSPASAATPTLSASVDADSASCLSLSSARFFASSDLANCSDITTRKRFTAHSGPANIMTT
mmetsp:Transcript_37760/g.86090  ORF Transcript_37760/g.86090 Transcript_37760/m.86090 type:complete len:245 (+) Transcript_37760:665-1399(+)